MKKRKKIIIIISSLIGLPLICIALYILTFIIWFEYTISTDAKQATQRKVRLLYETDHKALLEACRTVLKEAREGKWEYRQYNIRLKRDPDADKLPEQILRLNPTYIYIWQKCIGIELNGGLHDFGVTAFSEDYEFEGHGDKKLLDRLWYYSDGYREVPDYEKYIESLRPESKEQEKNLPIQDGSK